MIRMLALALVLCALPSAAVTAQSGNQLFRHIDLGPHGRVELGQSFSQADRLATHEGNGVYKLRTGTFGGAAAIRIHVAASGRVSAMHFEYDREQSTFASYVQNATTAFGQPHLFMRMAPEGGQDEVARWEDAATALEVVRRARGDNEEVFVAMYDREVVQQ